MEKPNIYKKSYPHIFFNTQKFDILGTSLFSSDFGESRTRTEKKLEPEWKL